MPGAMRAARVLRGAPRAAGLLQVLDGRRGVRFLGPIASVALPNVIPTQRLLEIRLIHIYSLFLSSFIYLFLHIF